MLSSNCWSRTHDGHWRLHKAEVEEVSAKDAGYIAGWGSSSTSAPQPPHSNCSPAQRRLHLNVFKCLKQHTFFKCTALIRKRKVYFQLKGKYNRKIRIITVVHPGKCTVKSKYLLWSWQSNTALRIGTLFHYWLCPCQRFARLKRIWVTINTH